jgi:hypothetical protein
MRVCTVCMYVCMYVRMYARMNAPYQALPLIRQKRIEGVTPFGHSWVVLGGLDGGALDAATAGDVCRGHELVSASHTHPRRPVLSHRGTRPRPVHCCTRVTADLAHVGDGAWFGTSAPHGNHVWPKLERLEKVSVCFLRVQVQTARTKGHSSTCIVG